MTISTDFFKAWMRNNLLAYVLGLGLLHPIIAHGFTGNHAVALTIPQLIMHTLSLLVFACLYTAMRNRTFRLAGPIGNWHSLPLFLAGIPVFFWLGYYTLYIPFDILFMLLFIGLVNGLSLKAFMKEPKKWLWQSLLIMFAGALAGIICGISCYFWFIKDMKGIAGDFTIWLLISTPTAIVSTLVSRRILEKQLRFQNA